MDDELLELQKQFEFAQQAKSSIRLSKRSVVELVQKLHELHVIDFDLLHTISSKEYSLAPEIPEDLYHLIKKAVSIRKHLERNRKDKDSKFKLILVESGIQRLARYYKKTKKLPPVWKY
ncbi:40S ribosomal protein S13-like [Fagus crenata]